MKNLEKLQKTFDEIGFYLTGNTNDYTEQDDHNFVNNQLTAMDDLVEIIKEQNSRIEKLEKKGNILKL